MTAYDLMKNVYFTNRQLKNLGDWLRDCELMDYRVIGAKYLELLNSIEKEVDKREKMAKNIR